MLADVPKSEYGPEVERQMCDEIKTFLLAGHETSAAMLIWTTWELVKAPEKMKIATEEAKKVYKNSEKKNKKTPSRDDLNGLEYIVGALKESLRLYSVVPVVTRKCLGDDYLGGEFIPKGVTVIISVQGVHHREDLWENAQAFEPRTVRRKRNRRDRELFILTVYPRSSKLLGSIFSAFGSSSGHGELVEKVQVHLEPRDERG